MPQPRVYFDNAATTPLDPRVRVAMGPSLERKFGNPSSLHAEGRAARAAVERARTRVPALVGARPAQVVFTSSGTEANNLALANARSSSDRRAHVITSNIEHPAIRETCLALARRGKIEFTAAGVDADEVVRADLVRSALRPNTRLISVMAANNITVVLPAVAALARVAHAHGCLLHTDAVQAAGKLPLDLERDRIDLISISARKLHGPQGIAALVARERDTLRPTLHGGGSAGGLRSGTENGAAIVGFGEAARIAVTEHADNVARLIELRDRMIQGICHAVPGAYLIGHAFRRLPGHVCVGFAALAGESITFLLALYDAGFAVSTGSACSAHHAGKPSHVLQAVGFDAIRARGALRISVGRFNTADDVDSFLDALPRIARRLRPTTGRARPSTGVPQ